MTRSTTSRLSRDQFVGAFCVSYDSKSSDAVHGTFATTLPDLVVSQDLEHWKMQPDICRLAA
eukprot:7266281-Prorocentrum_lima.AAC.1